MPFMFCDPPSIIVRLEHPTGSTYAEEGKIVLANGDSFRLGNDTFGSLIRSTDHIQVCFGPFTHSGTGRYALIGDVEADVAAWDVAVSGQD